MRLSLRLDFSIIENFESMQTINNKRKYKIQQLFKMLSPSLDTCMESFYPNVTTLRSGLCCRRSVCLSSVCLSVTLVHPTQGVEPIGKISSPLCTLAIP